MERDDKDGDAVAVSLYGIFIDKEEGMGYVLLIGLFMLLIFLWVMRYSLAIRRVEVDESEIRYYISGKMKKEVKFEDKMRIGIKWERSFSGRIRSFIPCFYVEKEGEILIRICDDDISYPYLECIVLSCMHYSRKFMEKSSKLNIKIYFSLDTDPASVCPWKKTEKNGQSSEREPDSPLNNLHPYKIK